MKISFVTFPSAPQPSWQVAHNSLEEEDKAHPLIVGVMFTVLGVMVASTDTWIFEQINKYIQEKLKKYQWMNYQDEVLLRRWLS